MKNLITESEKAVQEAFILKEKGHSLPMIMAIFPKFKDQIQTAFYMAALVRDNSDELLPSEESLQKMLLTLDQKEVSGKKKNVAVASPFKMPKMPKIPRMPAMPSIKISSLTNLTKYWKIFLPALALIAIIIGVASHGSSPDTSPSIHAEDIVKNYEVYMNDSGSVAIDDDSVVNSFYSDVENI